ncbi:DNA polymerase III subunit gamma/tau [Paenibacillus senegalensis]|uniref:DNA polymerase III subunit gamma/tau n=1 Tax=Paenibacillus senegalensis TaxID=1465766 RepID=UPI0002E9FCA9|nr:DNA polymerase III subunit gamma/tau [Paenibacillus senegalensis]
MTQHMALYRKWRPQQFQDVIGQQHIIQTLQNSLKEGRFTHAYLFSGPRGTGKTTAAKLLAKAVNCEHGPAVEPCNECEACLRITQGAVMDVVEIDAASNRGVDEIRELRDKVKFAPTEVRHKVYIIDEVHMLTTEAFNALLKTLEEPPVHVMFILATTEPHKIPATIISRCQRFDFRRVSLEEQVSRLERICNEEHIEAEAGALQYIARLSQGGMRDALSLLEQISSFAGGTVTYEHAVAMTGGIADDQFEKLAQCILQRNIPLAMQVVEDFMDAGKSPDKCVESLMHYFRDLLIIQMVKDSAAVTDRILQPERFRPMAESFSRNELFQIIEVLNRYHGEMKYSSHPAILFEIAVMKLCSSNESAGQAAEGKAASAQIDDSLLETLKQRIAKLEQTVDRLRSSPASEVSGAGAASTTSSTAAGFGGRRSTASLNKPKVKLDRFLPGREAPLFKKAKAQWSEILLQVKEQKITVHAWLVNGEPVAFADGQLLLAFRSEMHKETTEKPANKQLIERVLEQVLGEPLQLIGVMQKDWEEAVSGGEAPPTEELQWESEDQQSNKEPWISEAIEQFGEDLVKIKSSEE